MGSSMDPGMDPDMDSNMDSNMTLPEQSINFPILKTSMEAFTTEFMKIQHVPAFDQGATILAKLDQLQTALNVVQNTLGVVQTTQNQFQTTLNHFEQQTAANFTQLEGRIQDLYIS